MFTRDERMMPEFLNRHPTTILALTSAAIIVGLNAYLVVISL
jgi:Mn2+/Fe2+ NRAMP family transporter